MFLCSPNNPTGTNLLPQIRKVIEGDAGKSVIVVDEAYSEFANCSIMDVYGDIPENVVIMRTLSKAFGLAGMRVGYMLARREMTSRIDDVRLPYNVSSASTNRHFTTWRSGTTSSSSYPQNVVVCLKSSLLWGSRWCHRSLTSFSVLQSSLTEKSSTKG